MDTAESGTGDHENFFAKLDMTQAILRHFDGKPVNDDCQPIAVKIRQIDEQRMWPNIPQTTLLFSEKKTYLTESALDFIGESVYYKFHKAVKPLYG